MNSFPVLAWKNLFNAAPAPAITHSPDADGCPFANVSDWRDYTLWQSSESGELFVKLDASALPGQAVSVDTLAIAGHNLNSAGVTGIALKWSDDDATWYDCFTPLDPADDRVIFRRFAAQSRRYFKLVIPSGYTDPPAIGVLFIGLSTEVPAFPDTGFDPDAQECEAAAEYSKEGRLLGIAARFRKREIKASFSRLPASFIRDEWLPFFVAHGEKPFFFAWDPEGKPEEAYLVRLASPKFEAPYDKSWRGLSLTMSGVER
ncbi:MAG TPA: hypothetical protein VM658_14620 [bacterium]|nr:hypothetical protein [bacterium]